jgi:hypothetical protein
MDAAGVDVQVLSLTEPGVEQLEGDEAPGKPTRRLRKPSAAIQPAFSGLRRFR